MSMNSGRAVGRATLLRRVPPERPTPPDFLPPPPEPADDRPRNPAWHWLLLVPAVVPLVTPLYNRIEPRLFGVPFFYWCQLAFVLLDVAVIGLVYKLTKRRT
jgi:Protein of unknown function (DUF3311)